MVGLHKGYDPAINRNICTMISKEMIIELKKWEIELNSTFQVEGMDFVASIEENMALKAKL